MKIEAIKYMLMAQDMDRAVAFYRDVIGLEVRFESPHWSELVRGDAMVALHGGGDGGFEDTGLGIQVENIETACAEVVGGGGAVRRAPRSRPGEPIILAHLTDPEGNGFMLSQYAG